jgi:hypothetical protein
VRIVAAKTTFILHRRMDNILLWQCIVALMAKLRRFCNQEILDLG